MDDGSEHVHLGDLSGSPAPTPPPRRVPPFRLAVATVLALVVGAAAFAGVKLFALRGTSDVLVRMVPADADVYASVYLDPSLGQKVAIRALAAKFPATRNQADLNSQIDRTFNEALRGSGLDFERDVKPWLGSQIAVVVWQKGGANPVVVLIRSKDDAAAARALNASRAKSGDTWAQETLRGVTLNVGTPTGQFQTARTVYAMVDHTVILTDDVPSAEAIVDTDAGATGSLDGVAAYTDVVGRLPSDRLGTLYVNLAPYVQEFERSLSNSGLDVSGLTPSLGDARAYTALAMSVSAQSSGIAADLHISVDASKLTGAQRTALGAGNHRNAIIDWVPPGSYGFLAEAGVGQAIQRGLQQAEKSDPNLRQTIQDLGALDANGPLSHLTGDGGFVVGPGVSSSSFPGIAFLAATDDEAGLRQFLDRVAAKVVPGSSGTAGSWQTSTYKGTPVGTFVSADLAKQGIAPSYAVTGGMAIVASTPNQVERLIDTHLGGTKLADSANFTAAAADSRDQAGALLYLDVESVLNAVRGQLSPAALASFDAAGGPGSNLRPITSFILSGTSGSNDVGIRIFVSIH
jgi:hypothetical protein